MSSEDFSMSKYIVSTPTGSSETSKGRSMSSKDVGPTGGPLDARFSTTPLSFSNEPGVSDSLSNDAVPFQLPSFLLGAPTPVAGGGADAFSGSFSNLGDFGNWLGGSGTSFNDSDMFASSSKVYGMSSPNPHPQAFPLVPATLDKPHKSGPLDFSIDSPEPSPGSGVSPSPVGLTPRTFPSTSFPAAFEVDSFRSLPLASTTEVTGTKAPPLYSTTGFDMLGILARVASRPNPTIVLGPVDLSCSFVVVDVQRYDHPIIYASPTFFKLTGYEATEVIGRNCRFLQAPDGVVERGSPRSFTDQTAVAHIKKCLGANKECQANLMNYRKGGVPFLNLVSIIPITGDNPDEIQFHVGFQVDLVHQPNAILQTMRDGTYLVNYSNMSAPTAGLTSRRLLGEGKRGDGSGALSASLRELSGEILPGGLEELAKRTDEQNCSEFYTMLLENADDLVHVLSVKGVLQYASPSLLHHLEYSADEIIGMTIADIAHPQDLTPITRELKEASSLVETSTLSNSASIQKTVHLLYRVRRKRSGMVWLEASGRLHMEPGKTRKSIIFSGRLRNVPSLTWRRVERMGGLGGLSPGGDSGVPFEFWARLSTVTGLFIFVERRVDEILGHDRDELMGTSFLGLFDSKERGPVREAMFRSVSGESSAPITIEATLVSRRDNVRKAADIIFYHPDHRQSRNFCSSAGTELASSGPSSLLVQFRIRSNSPAVHRPWRVTGHGPASSIYDELDVARGTNWNYEVETIRQSNEKLRLEIAAISSERDDGSGKRKRQATSPPSTD